MALITCKDCGQEMSSKATSCPKCGAPAKKKTSLLTGIVTIVAVLWLIGYIASLSSQSDPASSAQARTARNSEAASNTGPKRFKIGETAHVGYTSYAVWKAGYRNKLSDNPYLDQKPDASFLVVELTVRNNDKEARSIPPFKLVDENGAEYETTSKAFATERGIGVLDSLNPSVEKQGLIVFDVPRGKRYKLLISGGYWSKEKALIELGL